MEAVLEEAAGRGQRGEDASVAGASRHRRWRVGSVAGGRKGETAKETLQRHTQTWGGVGCRRQPKTELHACQHRQLQRSKRLKPVANSRESQIIPSDKNCLGFGKFGNSLRSSLHDKSKVFMPSCIWLEKGQSSVTLHWVQFSPNLKKTLRAFPHWQLTRVVINAIVVSMSSHTHSQKLLTENWLFF